MSITDGKSWWEENQARARRLGAICSLLAFIVSVILLHSEIKEFLSSHSWWQDAIVVLAGIAVPVLAYFELGHSKEANELRREANRFRAERVRLQQTIGELEAEKAGYLGQIAHLEEERNLHLKQIAANTQRPVSEAERRAAILRQHLGTTVAVSESKGIGAWASPEIVEVRNDNVVALFSPHSSSSGAARCVYVHCDDLEIVELPRGSLQLRVLKRYGDTVQLGEITKWEDRFQQAANPSFAKGDCVCHAQFTKPGSSERRTLYVYASHDGTNSFLLEASTGEKIIANNVEISKRFVLLEIDYAAAGFTHGGSGKSGGSPYPIFIR
jgi:hypothetical protein